MSYKNDIFISYPRIDPIGPWVAEVFDHQLRRWLRAELGERAVFRDTGSIEPGQPWPERLIDELQRSRLMIAIWSPPYFTSAWCMAELATMRAREAALGIASDGARLIYPIRFSDGDAFDDAARESGWHDFEPFNDFHPAFESSLAFRDLIREVKAVCRAVGQRLAQCPPWSPEWPVVPAPPLRAGPAIPPPEFL